MSDGTTGTIRGPAGLLDSIRIGWALGPSATAATSTSVILPIPPAGSRIPNRSDRRAHRRRRGRGMTR